MCGRARCSLSREEVRAEANIARWRDEEAYEPSFNVSPSRSTPVLKQPGTTEERELHTMKWGLVPSYTKAGEKPDYFRMFNARSETVNEKGVFKKLLTRQRCVVFMNGFYEWKKEGRQKQPYFIFRDGHNALRMAGLFDIWKGAGEEPMFSFTILTTDSSEKLQWLHDRMPVILPDEAAVDLWLSGEGDDAVQQLSKLCQPYDGEDLQWFAVDPLMSNMKRDGPECCKPLKRKSIATFFKPKQEANAAEKPVKTEQDDPGIAMHVKREDGAPDVKLEDADAKIDTRNTDEASVKPGVGQEGNSLLQRSPQNGASEDQAGSTAIKAESSKDEAADDVQDGAKDIARDGPTNSHPNLSPSRQQGTDSRGGNARREPEAATMQTPSVLRSEQKRAHEAASPPSALKKPKTSGHTPQQGKITAFFGQKASK